MCCAVELGPDDGAPMVPYTSSPGLLEERLDSCLGSFTGDTLAALACRAKQTWSASLYKYGLGSLYSGPCGGESSSLTVMPEAAADSQTQCTRYQTGAGRCREACRTGNSVDSAAHETDVD